MKKAKAFRKVISFVLLVVVLFTSVQASLVSVSAAAYDNTHKNTGVQRVDIISVAKTQIGYREGENNNTKYGKWYGLNYQPWCAMFVSWCARQAKVPTDILRNCAIASPEPGYFDIPFYDGLKYTPQPGDLFFTKTFSHVGLVAEVHDGYFITVEGNTNDDGSNAGIGVFSLRRETKNYLFGVPDYNYLSKGHTCKAGTSYTQEVQHPHRLVYTCVFCSEPVVDNASENYVPGCVFCDPLNPPVLDVHTDSFLSPNTVVFKWNDVGNVTQYDFELEKKDSSTDEWQTYEHSEYVNSGFSWELEEGDYRAKVIARNTIYHSEEYPDGISISSESVYFSVDKTTYNVVYDANGGENAPESHIKQAGIGNVLSTSEPYREGYKFLGWSDKPNAKSPKYNPGDMYIRDADIVFYAVWRDLNAVMLRGDSNEDSTVNVKDATAIQKHLAGISKLSDNGFILADSDGDGTVNIKDATAIQKYVAGIETGFGIGEAIE